MGRPIVESAGRFRRPARVVNAGGKVATAKGAIEGIKTPARAFMASDWVRKGRATARLMDSEAEVSPRTASPELAELAKTIGVKADATTVFGSPIVDGERTVVPVAFGMVVGLAIAMRLMRPRATIAR
jgi:hypothetical protein